MFEIGTYKISCLTSGNRFALSIFKIAVLDNGYTNLSAKDIIALCRLSKG